MQQCVIIEDNEDNQLVLVEILEQTERAQIAAVCATGSDFLQWLQHHPQRLIHTVFLDLQLPNEDGYAVLQQIRTHRQLPDVHVIAYTAYVRPVDIARCRAAGFDGFIGKPINPDRIMAVMHAFFDGHPLWEHE